MKNFQFFHSFKVKTFLILFFITFVSYPSKAWKFFGTEFVYNGIQSQQVGDNGKGVMYGTEDTYFLGICIKSVPAERHFTVGGIQ